MGHKTPDVLRERRARRRTAEYDALTDAQREEVDRVSELVRAQCAACPHCDGYGGHWTSQLTANDVGWAQDPTNQDDGVGYAMCRCMTLQPTCTFCNAPILGGPGCWHDRSGAERCESSPTSFHETQENP